MTTSGSVGAYVGTVPIITLLLWLEMFTTNLAPLDVSFKLARKLLALIGIAARHLFTLLLNAIDGGLVITNN